MGKFKIGLVVALALVIAFLTATPSQAGTSLLVNRSFEGGLAGWKPNGFGPNDGVTCDTSHHGYCSLHLVANGNTTSVHQTIDSSSFAGKRITIRFYYKTLGFVPSEPGSGALRWQFLDGAGGGHSVSMVKDTHGWLEQGSFGVTIYVPTSSQTATFGITERGTSGEVWVDDIRIEIAN